MLDRLQLEPGQRLLEIGCGWGTLAIEAGKRGASVVGLTLSTEQKAWAECKIAEAGLGGRVEIRLQDYRDTAEQFDAVASIEMVEAVGRRWRRVRRWRRQFRRRRRGIELVIKCERENSSANSSTTGSFKQFARRNPEPPVRFAF